MTVKKDILNEYVEKKIQLDELKTEVDKLKEGVTNYLLKTEDQKAFVGDATITLRESAKYKYSKKVTIIEETIKAKSDVLKMLKKEEETSGVAELLEKSYSPVVR